MAEDQRHARIFGVLFIITFITSIAALAALPARSRRPGRRTSPVAGRTTRSTWERSWSSCSSSRTSERPSSLYPIARRQNEALAIRYVAARIIECVFIATGTGFVLGVLVSLRHDLPGGDDVAWTLAELKDLTFLFGPGLIVPFGNGLILGYLMYKSGLVPRSDGLVRDDRWAAPPVGNFGVLFDWWEQTDPVSLLVIPEIIWEAFLGIYCAIWGFRRDSPILSGGRTPTAQTG